MLVVQGLVRKGGDGSMPTNPVLPKITAGSEVK